MKTKNDKPRTVTYGQSEVIGVVILLSFTIITVGMVLYSSGGTTANLGDRAADESMLNQFAQMDSQISSSVFSDSGSSQGVKIRMNGGTVESNPNASRMKILFDEKGGPEKTLVNTTLGNIEYTNEDTVIAYEGGGVWRSSEDSNRSVMISSPEFHYGGEESQQTLTIPIISIDSKRAIGGDEGSVSVRSTGTEIKHGGDPLDNPLTEGDLKVTVESGYYRAWGRYFDQRTESVVLDRDHDENSVTVELSAPEINVTDEVGGATGGFFNTKVDFTDKGEMDSYTGGTYPSPPSNPEPSAVPSGVGDPPVCDYEKANADVFTTSKEFIAGQNTCTMGNVFVDSGKIAKIDQDSYIHKDVHSTSGVKVNQGGRVNGDIFVELPGDSINGVVGGDVHVNTDNKLEIDSGATVKGNIFTRGEVRIPDGTVEGDVHTQKGGSDAVKCGSGGGNIDGTVHVSGGSPSSVGSGCNPAGVAGSPDEPKPPDIPDEPNLMEHSNPGTDLKDSNHPNCDISSSNKIIMDGSGKQCTIKAVNIDGDWGAIDEIKAKDGAELRFKGEVNLSIPGSGGILKIANAKVIVEDSLTVNGKGATFKSNDGKLVTDPEPHNATKVWLEFHKFEIVEGSEVTGFVYAPTDGSTIDLSDGEKGTAVYGGVAGPDDSPSSANVQIQGSVHVQEDLVGGSGSTGGATVGFNPTISEVHYLHITRNTVEVSR